MGRLHSADVACGDTGPEVIREVSFPITPGEAVRGHRNVGVDSLLNTHPGCQKKQD